MHVYVFKTVIENFEFGKVKESVHIWYLILVVPGTKAVNLIKLMRQSRP
jgi:hypothetical protein